MDEKGTSAPITHSTIFPPSYGDFALQCSDGIVCHFPRYLLGYLSGFFKDMFELPNSNESVQSMEPLLLTEPSKTIELLLQHMDPKIVTPGIDQDTIVDLLEAARKYQVPNVTTWFQEEVLFTKAHVLSQNRDLFLLVENPLLIFYCALRFDLPNLGRPALKILAHCHMALLESSNPAIELRHYLYVMKLRNERTHLFLGIIRGLADLKQVTESLDDPEFIVGETSRVTCATCTATRALWLFDLQYAIHQEPSLASFRSAYENNGGVDNCKTCKTSSWANYYREYLDNWKAEANRIEEELPEWPAWFS